MLRILLNIVIFYTVLFYLRQSSGVYFPILQGSPAAT